LAAHAWVLETEAVDVHVGARAGLARDRSDARETVRWGSSPDWTGGHTAGVAASDTANAIAPA
jgi:hypothetical protein